MNASYRSIWNQCLGAWVAAPENARTGGARSASQSVVAAALYLAFSSAIAGTAVQIDDIDGTSALGTGGTVPATAADTSIAIGGGSGANAANSSIAVGNGANANSLNSIAVGTGAAAIGNRAIAVGAAASAATTAGDFGGIAIGQGASALTLGSTNIAIGVNAFATGTINAFGDSIAIGNDAQAIGQDSTAIGGQTTASGTNSIAIGNNLTAASAQNTIAIGVTTTATAANAVVIGNFSSATGENSTGLGFAVTASGAGATALGASATASGDFSQALGTAGTVASGAASVAVGRAAKSIGVSSVAVGDAATANDRGGVAIGEGSLATGTNAISVGASSSANFASSIAAGLNSKALAERATAIGTNAQAVNAGDVSLGSDTVSSAVTPTPTGVINGQNYNYAGGGAGVVSAVSVGTPGSERQIQNVAAGRVTATSTDAINGSQLFATNSAIAGIVANVTQVIQVIQGGDTTATSSQWITGSPTTYVAPVSTGRDGTAVGSGAVVNANNSVAVGVGAAATTANSVALGNGSTTAAATPTAGTTIQGQTYNFAGAAPGGVVSVGAPGAERQIQNVAAGQLSPTSTNAVNGSQLYATNQAINNIQTGGGVKYFHANSQAADSQAAGAESVAIGPQAVALGGGSFAGGSGAQANGAGSIALGANAIAATSNGVALGNGASADRAGMNGQKEMFSNAAVQSTQGAVSVGATGNERQIINVAGGTQATDATNVRQLQAVQAGGVRYDTGTDGATNFNSVTLGNGGSSGPVTVHNVAPGVAPTDAVNVQQLTSAKKALSGGIAASAAMAVLTPVEPGRYHVSGAIAGYNGQAGIGFNVLKRSDNGQTTLHSGLGWGSGGSKAIVRVGFGFSFN